MQLRKTIKNLQDVEYNFKLIDRLLKGHMLDGDYIREVPALKISGRLEAHQITVGHSSVFEKGYDPDTLAEQAGIEIEKLKGSLGEMAFEDQVELAKLGTTIVSGGYLQTIKINAASITAGTISAARIASESITASKIRAKTITADQIKNSAVNSDILGKGSVITVKLASQAVTGAKIAAEAVTASKIAAGAITAGKIAAGAITAGKIAAGAITAGKIAAGAITADKLAASIILSGTIWAGYNKVRLNKDGIRVYGESLSFYSSDMKDAGYIYGGYRTDKKRTLYLSTDIITLAANDYARAYEMRVTRLIPNPGDVSYVGRSSNKFDRGYFNNLPGCPTPTSNSGIGIMKKIGKPEVRNGKHGTRHYFLDDDFPSEMKCKVIAENEHGEFVETEEEEIEYIRTIGVLVQSVRELIDKVEKLEKEVYKNEPGG